MSVTSTGICDRRPFNLLCCYFYGKPNAAAAPARVSNPPEGGGQRNRQGNVSVGACRELWWGEGWCLTTFGALTLSDCLPAPIKLNSIGKRRSASDDTTNCGSATNNNSNNINAIFA